MSVFCSQVGKYDHCKHADAGANYLLASAVIKHPDFDINSPDVANDIAILKVSKEQRAESTSSPTSSPAVLRPDLH